MATERKTIMLVVTVEATAIKFLLGFANFLCTAGYKVILVADNLSKPDSLEERNNLEFIALKMRREPNLIQDIFSFCNLLRLTKSIKPDVVYFATPKASLLTSVSSYLLRTPVRIYGLWGLRYETTQGLKRIVFMFIEKVIVHSSTAVLANSNSLRALAIESKLVLPLKISVVGSGSSHGVDTEWFSPDAITPTMDSDTIRFCDENPAFTIGYIGRMHPDKGVNVLIQAAREIISKGLQIKLILVGADEGAQLITSSENLNKLPIHVSGGVSDVRPYLKEFDINVLMSEREGFPNAVLEAAAMEVPSIVSNATGCVDSVIDGVTGVVVDKGDYKELAVQIENLYLEPNKTQALGRAARENVIADFEQKYVWELTLAFIEEQSSLKLAVVHKKRLLKLTQFLKRDDY